MVLGRLWRALRNPVESIIDPDCGECFGRGFDAGRQRCTCVREIRIGRKMTGHPDGPTFITCGACGTIIPRDAALPVTPDTWACSDDCAAQIAAEQAW